MKTFEDAIVELLPCLQAFAASMRNGIPVEDETEDLVQETVLRALENRDKFTEGTNMKAWLCTILKNIFINKYRSSRVLSKYSCISNLSQDVFLDGLLPASSQTPLSNLLQKERLALLRILDDKERRILYAYGTGVKYREIAEKEGIKEGSVKSAIFYARLKLKQNEDR